MQLVKFLHIEIAENALRFKIIQMQLREWEFIAAFLLFVNQDALRYENGRNICGSSIIVEWAKGPKRGVR